LEKAIVFIQGEIMGDLTVILDKKNITARIEAKTLKIIRPNTAPERVPLSMIGQVLIIGNPLVSCDVWRSFAQYNIPATLLSSRGKPCAAHMGAGLSATVTNRIAQYRALFNSDCSLEISRWLLTKKMQGQIDVLDKLSGPKLNTSFFQKQINECIKKLELSVCGNQLMGYEGVAASAYFKCFVQKLPLKWNFKGRNRRPSLDPVNALLSLSYTIAMGQVSRSIVSKGLDASLGFLHTPQPNRENLVLDIIEPLRPQIDWFVLQLLDNMIFVENFNTNPQDGCRLTKEGRNLYYSAWALWQEISENNIEVKSRQIIKDFFDFFPTSLIPHRA
jgi:CRISP-associated protein Cas1